jgi:DNA-binding beta-propeller fold protein YncE
MRVAGCVVLVLAVALCVLAPPPEARADDDLPITLTALPPEGGKTEHESVVLSAQLESDDEPVGGLLVNFYIVTEVFGERLMNVGSAVSDAGGAVSVVYRPTWTGDHTVVAHFNGGDGYAASETSFHFDALVAESAFERADFGLNPIRRWLPVAVGIAVLAVWLSVIFALVSTVMAIRTAVRTAPVEALELPPFIPPPSPPQGDAAKRLTIAVSVLVVLAGLPLLWFAVRVSDRGDDNQVTDGSIPGDQVAPITEQLPATLVRSVQTASFDENGQPEPGSVTLPADLAITAGRVRILDSTGGRIVTVSPDGKLIPIQQGQAADGTTLKGSPAMASLGSRLFVVSARGDRIAVVDESGLIEGSIIPALPAGHDPVAVAGVAVSDTGRIWLSDAANHRVILLNNQGEFELVIGQGAATTDDEGFNTPTGLASDADGNLYVSDTGNGVVKKYSPLGVLLQIIGKDRLESPEGVTVSPASGRVFVSDSLARQVAVFEADGSYVGSITTAEFEEPRIVRTAGDDLYVLDSLAGMLVFRTTEEQVSQP